MNNTDWQEANYYPDDTNQQKALNKSFDFKDFASALDFVNQVGAIAEELGHHPDINLSWGKVSIWTTSHDKHKITERDYELAKKIDDIKKG